MELILQPPIIGGGDAGVARECISKGFNLIDWYELDPEVVEACYKHLPKISSRVKESNSIKTFWGDAFESIKSAEDSKYDKIFVDLNDDQYCIDLATKNMNGLKRNFKNLEELLLLKLDQKIKNQNKLITG